MELPIHIDKHCKIPENGSTACSAVLKEKLGRNFDLSDKAEALEYTTSGGPEACAKVVARAVEIASEVIAKRSPSK